MTKVTFLGHSCFWLEKDETSVLIDPFLSGNPTASANPFDLKPDVILITHGHSDHLGDVVQIARNSGACVVGMLEMANWARAQGLTNVQEGNLGGRVNFEFGFAKFVPAWHSSSIGGEFTSLGNPCGYIIQFFDHVFYHTGDTSVFSDMRLIAELTPVDVALMPIGGLYTMDIPEAVKAVEFIKPKVVIPMHYNTWPPIVQNPEDFKDQVESKMDTRCVILRPGETMEISVEI